MNIGIIVHSKTGNTYSVAEKLQKELIAAGHTVAIEKLMAVNDFQYDVQKIYLKSTPDISGFDAIIFGAPVRGFSLSPVLEAYLTQLVTLQGKKVACFVTQFFPFPWMGGNRAIKQMKQICELRGAKLLATGIINWSNNREMKITNFVEKQTSLLS